MLRIASRLGWSALGIRPALGMLLQFTFLIPVGIFSDCLSTLDSLWF